MKNLKNNIKLERTEKIVFLEQRRLLNMINSLIMTSTLSSLKFR